MSSSGGANGFPSEENYFKRNNETDLSEHPLGPLTEWPSILQASLNSVLSANFPVLLLWEEQANYAFFSEAFRACKEQVPHTLILGANLQTVWPEAGSFLLTLASKVYAEGKGLTYEGDLPFLKAAQKEGWMNLSPVFDESKQCRGVHIIFKLHSVPHSQPTASLQSLLQKSEERTRILTNATQDAVWDWDLITNKLWWNEQFKTLFLYEAVEPGIESWYNRLHPDDKERVTNSIQQAIREKRTVWTEEYRFRKGDGSYAAIFDRGYVLRDEQGEPYRMVGSMQDITVRKRMEAELRESEERFRTTFETAAVGIAQVSPGGKVVDANDKLCLILGYSKSELMKLSIQELSHPDDYIADFEQVKRILNGETDSYTIEKRYVQASGRHVWTNLTVSVVRQENGEPKVLIAIVEDINDRKTAELKLRESEMRFRGTFENAAVGIAHVATDGSWLQVNDRLCAIVGYSREELLRINFQKITHPDDLQEDLDKVSEVLAGKIPYYSLEKRYIHKQGHSVWIHLTVSLVRESCGSPQFFIAIVEDISARKQTEMALKQSELQFRNFSNNIQNLAWIADGRGWIHWYNQRWYDYTGTTLEDMQGWGWEAVHHPDHRSRIHDSVSKAWQKGEPWELTFPLRSAAGEYRWFLTRAYPIKNEKKEIINWIGTNTDVHDEFESQRALRKSEEQFRHLADSMPQIVWVTDGEGQPVYLNQRWFEFTGLDATNSNPESWVKLIHPEDVEMTFDAWSACMKAGVFYEMKYRMKRKDGVYRWFLARAMPFKNDSGTIDSWVGTLTDIHEQKSSEEKLEALVIERTRELHRSNEDLTRFAHVASHDLKEPVRKISTFAEILRISHGETLGDGVVFLNKMIGSAQRMMRMIDSVLAYSSFNSKEPVRPLRLNDAVLSVQTDLELLISEKGAHIQVGELPVVECAQILIHQLFYNLINNALKFVRKDVKPEIRISAELEERDGRAWAIVQVADNGIGFDTEEADKIFENFVRLHSKDAYEGTGLGLTLCKEIVQRHGGRILAEGKAGKGATFTVELPLKQEREYI